MTARDLLVRRGSFRLDVPAFASGGGTALLGPNGAGKTTLLLALQGLVPATGRVERPARCAAVFARPAVLRGSVLWNVAVVARTVLRASAGEAAARAERVLAGAGIAALANADARSLSTGQRQRLALARALAAEPQALFLDEPFANVDADGRPELRELVAAYVARTDCELVMATSSLTDAFALCRDAVVLAQGEVTYAGPVDRLPLAGDRYVQALYAESIAIGSSTGRAPRSCPSG